MDGISANGERLAQQTSTFVGVITAFTPYIGYAAAANLAERALEGKRDVAELIVEAGLMEREDVRILMEPARLSGEDTSVPRLSRTYGRPAAESDIRE